MIRKMLIVAVAAWSGVVIAVTSAPAQMPSAEVRTWSGQVHQLADPSLEVLYTIVIPGKDEGPQPAEGGATAGT